MSNENRTPDDDLDRVFKALANRIRRAICDELKVRPLTTGQLASCFSELDRTTVMMHLRVLEEAGLVSVEKDGRERLYRLERETLLRVTGGWLDAFDR